MITRELIEKINSLWHKQKTVGLTAEEKEVQRAAREEYLDAIRGQVRGMLDSIKKPASQMSDGHSGECSCDKCKH